MRVPFQEEVQGRRPERSLHVPESRPTAELVVVSAEREALERWARRPKTAQAAAQRTRIVLTCATGATNTSEPRTQDPGATQAPCPPHAPPRACRAGPAAGASAGAPRRVLNKKSTGCFFCTFRALQWWRGSGGQGGGVGGCGRLGWVASGRLLLELAEGRHAPRLNE